MTSLAAVVVNHDYARYLPAALDSLLTQSTPFDEIVAVDDGSTDDSREVLARYRGRVGIVEIPNGGQLGACLAGLAATTADYVYFLDADDYARPELVETVRPELPAGPVKVQFQLEGVSAAVPDLESVFPQFPEPYDAGRMRADNRSIGFYVCPPTSGNVYQRAALQRLPLDRLDRRDFIDGPATMAMPYLGDIVSVPVPLAVYRVHGASHSRWSEPTAGLLAGEIDWFRRRWAETTRLLDMPAPPFDGERPLYVLERELMIAALDGRATTPFLGFRYVERLRSTHLPPRQKALLAGWALALAAPLPAARVKLVRARRSPVNRSRRLRGAVRLSMRGRKP